ncbi:MAG: TetR/AcrR family transcriptional regulator [Spirochaetota bacterium]
MDVRRELILEAARGLFVRNGLEQTTMRQIASESGITAVTLYRYFPDRHPIAIEVAARMVKRIFDVAGAAAHESLEASERHEHNDYRDVFCRFCLAMVDRYYELRDAYRYIGHFDHLYTGTYTSRELATLYRRRLREAVKEMPGLDLKHAAPEMEADRERMVTLTNVIMSYMQKMAARGALMGREQRVPLKVQLCHFRTYVGSILTSEFGWEPAREHGEAT